MSKKIKILTPRIYEHSDFFHNAVDFAREHSLNTNEFCLELSHYLVDNFDKVWKIEKPRVYKRVADLEAKLAESESELENQKEKYDKLYGCYKKTSGEDLQDKYRLAEENEQLKQQLTEKEDFIEDLMTGRLKPVIPRIKEIEKQYQDKISFAVEQLEKVKEDVKNVHIEDTQYDCYCFQETTRDNCVKIIDNQIDELKKEMK